MVPIILVVQKNISFSLDQIPPQIIWANRISSFTKFDFKDNVGYLINKLIFIFINFKNFWRFII